VGENNAPRGGGGGTPAAGFWAIPTGGRHSPARPHRAPFASSPPKGPAGPCAKPPRGRGGSPASGPAAPGLEGSRAASSRLPGGHTSHICHNLRHLNYKKIAVRADQAPSSPRRSAFRTAPQGWRESPWAPAARWRSAKVRRNRKVVSQSSPSRKVGVGQGQVGLMAPSKEVLMAEEGLCRLSLRSGPPRPAQSDHPRPWAFPSIQAQTPPQTPPLFPCRLAGRAASHVRNRNPG